MDLKSIRISEIKRLKSIYISVVDESVIDDSKYIGVKIVYDNDKYMYMRYDDFHFQEFIQKLLEVYKKEKKRRNIVLLGDLTKKLMNDKSFSVLNSKVCSDVGIKTYTMGEKNFELENDYLKEVLEVIIKFLKKYEIVNVDQIKGYGNRYIVTYSIGYIKKQFPIIISFNGSKLMFRFGSLDGDAVDVLGCVDNNLDKIDINWSVASKGVVGNINYDVSNKTKNSSICVNDDKIFSDTDDLEMSKSDYELICFYSDFLGFDSSINLTKTMDSNYIMGSIKALDGRDNLLFEEKAAQLRVYPDSINYKSSNATIISKDDGSTRVVLDSVKESIIIRKINIDNRNTYLREKKVISSYGVSYKYDVLVLEEGNTLDKPFNVIQVIPVDDNVKSMIDVKILVKKEGM